MSGKEKDLKKIIRLMEMIEDGRLSIEALDNLLAFPEVAFRMWQVRQIGLLPKTFHWGDLIYQDGHYVGSYQTKDRGRSVFFDNLCADIPNIPGYNLYCIEPPMLVKGKLAYVMQLQHIETRKFHRVMVFDNQVAPMIYKDIREVLRKSANHLAYVGENKDHQQLVFEGEVIFDTPNWDRHLMGVQNEHPFFRMRQGQLLYAVSEKTSYISIFLGRECLRKVDYHYCWFDLLQGELVYTSIKQPSQGTESVEQVYFKDTLMFEGRDIRHLEILWDKAALVISGTSCRKTTVIMTLFDADGKVLIAPTEFVYDTDAVKAAREYLFTIYPDIKQSLYKPWQVHSDESKSHVKYCGLASPKFDQVFTPQLQDGKLKFAARKGRKMFEVSLDGAFLQGESE